MILKQNTQHKRSTFVAFDFILVIIKWIKTNQIKHRHTLTTQKTKTCVVKIVVIIQNNKNSLHR